MKAVIMAGGEGTRLRPLTCGFPKPMVPVMDTPVMEHIINLLKSYNITEIIVTLQYKPDIIREYFGDGSSFGVKIKYFVEETPLGTAGSVKGAEEYLDDTFIVISGDCLTDVDLGQAVRFHRNKQADASLVLARVRVPLEYGVVITDKDGKIIRFLEKPGWSEVFSDTVNTGIYILNPQVLGYIKKGQQFDFAKDLFPRLLADNKLLYGCVTDRYWCDIGDLDAYARCHFNILDGKMKLYNNFKEIAPLVYSVSDRKDIKAGKNVQIHGPVFIGKNVDLKDGAKILEYSILGSNCVVGANSSVGSSIIWSGSDIGKASRLSGCVVCTGGSIKDNVSIAEDAVIGGNCTLNDNVVIKPDVKIWPGKTVESDSIVSSNLVLGLNHSKNLFVNNTVSGEINQSITPEFCGKLGACLGSLTRSGGKIGVSRDYCVQSDMMLKSFVAGLQSSGVEVYDFGTLFLPVTRRAVGVYGLDGAVHMTMQSNSAGSVNKLNMEFLDSAGLNIDRNQQRKIESSFAREDFSRANPGMIKPVRTINGEMLSYARNIINSVSTHSGNNFMNNTAGRIFNKKILINISDRDLKKEVFSLLNELNIDFMDAGGRFIKNCGYYKNFDMCAAIENQKLILTDNRGRILPEEVLLALKSLIIFTETPGASITVPVWASGIMELLAQQYNGKIIRTKSCDIAKRIKSDSTEFIFEFDPVHSLVKIIDFIQTNDTTLEGLLNKIPVFHMSKREVECSFEDKGAVIRRIAEENGYRKMELIDGVKIFYDNGWVLVIPHSEKAMCRVISEGYSEEFAAELTDLFANKVKKIACD